MKQNKKAILVLEDGRLFEGRSFGATGETYGEVVFNTSITGYQEILTDPSYHGQIVTMTYTQIGNYGTNSLDEESTRPWVAGFVVKECSSWTSNYRAQASLDDYLKQKKICGIEGIDTRALTRHLRSRGAMKGALSTVLLDPKKLLAKVKAYPGLVGRDLVKEVTCKNPYPFDEPLVDLHTSQEAQQLPLQPVSPKFRVVVVDCGVKKNILRELVSAGCQVTVVPAMATAENILGSHPDGVMLSNGPGDPAAVTYTIATVRQLIGKVPIFGICLGQQILGLAMGGKTYKLKFGHRGANQPVMDLTTRKVEITSHNHGFAVDLDSLAGKDVELTHINLNDKCVEGFRHKTLPVFCVQYHPEASPGPHDASYLFQRFIGLMKGGRHA